ILTGRGVSGEEARMMGLVNRLVKPGEALAAAKELALRISSFPQKCMRSDRESSYKQWDLSSEEALVEETRLGLNVILSGETLEGAKEFSSGKGRHGSFDK
ncbi:enoyl-CoA hydratase, partial [bacterium]|nr:enoyl-CoA hydratase [bacterium]